MPIISRSYWSCFAAPMRSGLDGATAKRRQDEEFVVLREALRLAYCLPEREFQSPTELQRYFSKRRAVLVDATEFATQRPQEKAAKITVRW